MVLRMAHADTTSVEKIDVCLEESLHLLAGCGAGPDPSTEKENHSLDAFARKPRNLAASKE
eukprot:m.165760 g.165760  ORF g.165760 m.165760 type:complete len:61 (+) comp15234_c5_seq15:983-1165(+)